MTGRGALSGIRINKLPHLSSVHKGGKNYEYALKNGTVFPAGDWLHGRAELIGTGIRLDTDYSRHEYKNLT